jgi:hypothetical protein
MRCRRFAAPAPEAHRPLWHARPGRHRPAGVDARQGDPADPLPHPCTQGLRGRPIRFGTVTDTYDAAGRSSPNAVIEELTRRRSTPRWRPLEGTREQTPPPYCAKKIQGVRTTSWRAEAKRCRSKPERGDGLGFGRKAISRRQHAVPPRVLLWDLRPRAGSRSRRRVGLRGPSRQRCDARGRAASRSKRDHAREVARKREAGDRLEPAWIPFDRVPLPFPACAVDSALERNSVCAAARPPSCATSPGERRRLGALLNGRRSELIAVGWWSGSSAASATAALIGS